MYSHDHHQYGRIPLNSGDSLDMTRPTIWHTSTSGNQAHRMLLAVVSPLTSQHPMTFPDEPDLDKVRTDQVDNRAEHLIYVCPNCNLWASTDATIRTTERVARIWQLVVLGLYQFNDPAAQKVKGYGGFPLN